MIMKKIAIVNQRYGLEVNGGSELYTRMLAEKLSKHYEVDIHKNMRRITDKACISQKVKATVIES